MIVLLRKLRISLKHIAVILSDNEQLRSLEILRENISELDNEIASLDNIRSVLAAFTNRLDESIQRKLHLDLLDDEELTRVADTLTLSKTTLKEHINMNDINELSKSNEILGQSSLNVRIVQLPPFTVASYHYIGADPEQHVGDVMDEFVRKSGLYVKKPDSRMFGFNHPNPGIREDNQYGYEVWITVPDDMELPEMLTKKEFEGGLYAALTIRFPEFQLWEDLTKWVDANENYEGNYSELGLEIMGGCLEEHMNWVYSSHVGWPENGIDGQIDLLLPIKKRAVK